MGELHPIDILILAIVCVISILIIIFRVRHRRKVKENIKKCGGGCNSCGMSSCSNYYKKDSASKK